MIFRAFVTSLDEYVRVCFTRAAMSPEQPSRCKTDFDTRHRVQGKRPLSLIVANETLSGDQTYIHADYEG